jgi:ribosomal protein L29
MQTLTFGFYVLRIFSNGAKVQLHARKGRSFVANADCSGASYSLFDSVDKAIATARERSVAIWNMNDRVGLLEEYGLTFVEVTEFIRYVWPRTEIAEHVERVEARLVELREQFDRDDANNPAGVIEVRREIDACEARLKNLKKYQAI